MAPAVYRRPAGARPRRLPRARRGSDRGVHRPDARTQEDARDREREDEHHARLAHAMLPAPPCAVLRNAVRAHRTGGTRRIPRRAGAAARHRLALASPYPRGLGWGEVRPSGRGGGRVPRLARRESLRDRVRIPVRARRRQQRGDDRRRRRGQEEPHPVRPLHDRRGSGRHPGQPLTRLPAGRWTG